MKIAILTRRAGFNMGSSLQAYAMSKFIERAGFPNVIINYDEYSGHWKWKIKPFINSTILKIFNIFPRLSNVFFRQKYNDLLRSKSQMNTFFQFERQYLPLTKKKYASCKSLKKDFNDYNACICGSDQIWSPYFFDPAFFLSFITSSKTKKIAYAPSLGITDLNLIKENQRELMQKMTFLSCREKEGANLISQITKKEIPVVLDPTLMLETHEWEKLANDSNINKSGKYILTYFLHSSCYEDSIPHAYIEKLKKETGLPVYNISIFNLINNIQADKQFDTVGPLDFLSLIKNAEWICTNSFHCCIFSYIFKRKFFVFERYMKNGNTGGHQNSRIYNLLQLLGLSDAITNPNSVPNIKKQYNFEIGEINLKIEREKSKNYLLNALSVNKE